MTPEGSIQSSVQDTLAQHPEWNLGEAAAAPQGTGAPPEPQAETPAPEGSFTSFDPNSLDPALQQRYKQMQADYTRKTQELAERERAAAAMQAQMDQYWQEQQQQAPAYGTPQAPAPEDPYNAYEPADPMVGQLLQRLQSVESRLQEEGRARQVQGVQHQMDRLESRLGRPLSQEEITKTGPLMRQHPGLSVEQAYYLAHRDQHETKLKAQAAEEAIRTLTAARGAPAPPSAHTGRTGEPAPPANARGFVMDALAQHGIK